MILWLKYWKKKQLNDIKISQKVFSSCIFLYKLHKALLPFLTFKR